MIQIFVVAVPGYVIREDFPHYLLHITLLLKTFKDCPRFSDFRSYLYAGYKQLT